MNEGTSIRLLVGLGNPGADYALTRHNAGGWLVDAISRHYQIPLQPQPRFKALIGTGQVAGHPLTLLKPQTYMNQSGLSVSLYTRYHPLAQNNVLIAHDDLDLSVGDLRLKTGGGHGGHNGLRDLLQQMSPDPFHRLRIGISHPGHKDAVVDYVLSAPPKEERICIDKKIQEFIELLPLLLKGAWQEAIQKLR